MGTAACSLSRWAVILFILPMLVAAGGCAFRNDLAETNSVRLFNGRDLSGWEIADYAGHGEARVENGQLIIESGVGLTGVTWTNQVPATVGYRIDLDAMKVSGNDFFCGLTFPVQNSYATLILGGWGGAVTGVSCINGFDASQNETTDYMRFDTGRWYHVAVQVTDDRIQAWVDDQQIVDLNYADKEISVRIDIQQSVPLGLSTWQTTAAMKNIVLTQSEPY